MDFKVLLSGGISKVVQLLMETQNGIEDLAVLVQDE